MLHRGGEQRGADGLGVITARDEKERKGDNERWEEEGERRGDVEVKRVIKYQKAIKTRRHINLPPSSPPCDAVFILPSLSLAS